MPKVIHVGLLFNSAYGFYRDALRGVRQFAETRPDWIFVPVFVEKRRLCWPGKLSPDGLIATLDTSAFVRAAEGFGRPIVTVGGVTPDLPYPRVAPDNRAVSRLAVQHFLERGLKHLAFLGHPRHLTSQEREAAFCDAVREAGCEPARCYNTHRNRAFDLLAQRWYVDSNVPRWIAALPTPVGIFAAVDYFGVALTQVCREIGLRIPEDVAVLGVDNDDVYCRLARPPLSSVIPSAQRVGYEAGALLDQLLNGHKPPREPVLVEPLGIQTRRSTEVLATDDEDVVAAARFIRESAHQPIKVADVLRVVPVSRRALERRFRRALGRGLAEEISRVRLERGRRLLAETDLSMSRVAEHSGFTDASHLTSVFHRELGITPSEYRRQTRVRNKSS